LPDLILPDLILLDGDKGQLSVAVEVMKELGIEGPALAAIAKDRDEDGAVRRGRALIKGERVFLPGRMNPVLLRDGTRGEHLLMAIRDEVHRFAIGYHRKVRDALIGSVLDKVPGIGPKKRTALFERFTDLKGIAGASVEELTAVPGVTEEAARRIKAVLESRA
jgi:excinuclease ABC subunit C